MRSGTRDDLDRSGNSTSSTASTTPTSSPPNGLKRSVSFSRLNIRQYERVLGDNPSCSSGPSVSLGWKYKDVPSMDIDAYEFRRSRRHMLNNGSRMMFSRMNRNLSLPNLPTVAMQKDEEEETNENNEGEDGVGGIEVSARMMHQSFRSATERCKVLTREEREELLLSLGYSRGDIVEAIRENVKIKNQRRKTVNNLNVMKAEEIIESLSRGMKRGACIGESGVGIYDDWIRH